MYESTGKPSVAKFRSRLVVIRKASQSGLELAERWNPKGRYYHTRQQMIKFYAANITICDSMLEFIDAGKRRR